MRFYRRCPAVFLLVLGGLAAFGGSKRVHAQEAYTFGVFPFLSPLRLEELYGPYGAVISYAIGHQVHFRTKATFEKFTEEIENQTYDVAFLHPFEYVMAADSFNYRALARTDRKLTAIIVVPENSKIRGVEDLSGKTLAMPSMTAAVSRLVASDLLKQNIDIEYDIQMSHHRTHTGCLQAIVIGTADACITNIIPLKVFLASGKYSLHTVYESTAIPSMVFAAHSRMPKDEREKIRAALISLKDTVQGRDLLARSGWKKGFTTADDREYDVVRKIMPATGKGR